jgi:1-acyl-sn-glycerol-3-phosphate acyltransferase
MVFALAGLSTITSFLPVARDTLATDGDTPLVAPRPSVVYKLVAGLSWPVVYGLYRLRATGRENLPDGAYVLAANHNSNFDPWPLGLPLFPKRYLRFMAKSELFWTPFKQFATACGAFPVRRGQADTVAVETATGLVRAGHVVVMFPEGTRRKKGLRKTREAKAHTGAARIALDAGVPLVPAGIVGTDRLAKLARLRVAFGEPIRLDDLAGRDDAAQIATDRLMEAIAQLEASA